MAVASIATFPQTGIFEQYSAAFAHMIAEQLRSVFEPLLHPATGVQQRLFTVEQAAIYLGRSETAVRQLIQKGTLPVTKIDGKVQIDRAALDKLIADCTFYES